jgi:hypothetical protein
MVSDRLSASLMLRCVSLDPNMSDRTIKLVAKIPSGKPPPSAEEKAETSIAIKAIDEHTGCPVHLHDGPVVLDRRVARFLR